MQARDYGGLEAHRRQTQSSAWLVVFPTSQGDAAEQLCTHQPTILLFALLGRFKCTTEIEDLILRARKMKSHILNSHLSIGL